MSTLYHIGVSGGKDSTALLLWSVHESGYDLSRIVATFADTGNEAPETYRHIEMLSEKVHRIVTIKPERDFYELARHKKRFPAARARFCTEELKMKPTRAFVNAFLDRGVPVLMLSGVRASESADRAKLPEREMSAFFGAEVYRPLLKWRLEDIWAIHERYGIPPNPLYAMGARRVGCLPCVMSRKREIAMIATKFPERIEQLREAEQTGFQDGKSHCFFHRNTVPLRYRSLEWETEDGKKMAVCGIADVVRWAVNDPDLYQESLDFDVEEAPACDSRYGACE